MGTIDSTEIENALWGHKGDLKEAFKNGDAPNWLKPKSPSTVGGKQDIRARNEGAQSFYEKWCDMWDQRNRNGGILRYSLGKHAPDDIQERIDEYCDSHTHNMKVRRLDPGEWFDGAFVHVRVGKRGGIQDIYVTAHYTD